MNNYDFPTGADTSDAPWNQDKAEDIEPCCPLCESKDLINDTPEELKGKGTAIFICNNCSINFSHYFF
jgi:hypothetical protein